MQNLNKFLLERGFIHDQTHELPDEKITGYIGFDLTANLMVY